MLSRIAETLYWMSRYLERTENMARIISTESQLALDLPQNTISNWQSIIDITGSKIIFQKYYNSTNEADTIHFCIANENHKSSLISSTSSARANAKMIRDIIAREAFEEINILYLQAKSDYKNGLSKCHRFEYLNSIIKRIQTIVGIFEGTMNRDEVYRFINIGRYLERADMTARIMKTKLLQLSIEPELQTMKILQWNNVLRSISGYQMYRRKTQYKVRPIDIVKFLLFDNDFPRSVSYCRKYISNNLSHLQYHQNIRQAIQVLSNQMFKSNENLDKHWIKSLNQDIHKIQTGLIEIHSRISENFFSAKHQTNTLYKQCDNNPLSIANLDATKLNNNHSSFTQPSL